MCFPRWFFDFLEVCQTRSCVHIFSRIKISCFMIKWSDLITTITHTFWSFIWHNYALPHNEFVIQVASNLPHHKRIQTYKYCIEKLKSYNLGMTSSKWNCVIKLLFNHSISPLFVHNSISSQPFLWITFFVFLITTSTFIVLWILPFSHYILAYLVFPFDFFLVSSFSYMFFMSLIYLHAFVYSISEMYPISHRALQHPLL